MFKKLLLCAALGAVLAGGSAAADQKVLRVATEASYPPFEFMDTKTGGAIGFDIDLGDAIAAELGMKVERISMGFDAIIPSVMTGMHDLGISAFTITPERGKNVLFSDPYYESGLSTLIRAADKDKIKGIKDLENRAICVQIGTSGALRAAQVPGAKVRHFNTVGETFLELGNRGCDAVIGDRPVNAYFLTTRKDLSKNYYHLPEKLNTEFFGILMKKDNTDLQRRINEALARLKANGKYREIYLKWFGEEPTIK